MSCVHRCCNPSCTPSCFQRNVCPAHLRCIPACRKASRSSTRPARAVQVVPLSAVQAAAPTAAAAAVRAPTWRSLLSLRLSYQQMAAAAAPLVQANCGWALRFWRHNLKLARGTSLGPTGWWLLVRAAGCHRIASSAVSFAAAPSSAIFHSPSLDVAATSTDSLMHLSLFVFIKSVGMSSIVIAFAAVCRECALAIGG